MDEASSCCNFHWTLVNCPAIYFFTLLRSNAFTFALEWEVNGHWTLIQNLQYEVQANIRQQAAVSRISGARPQAHRSYRQVQARKRRGSSKFSDWVALTTYYTIANQVTWKWKWNQENCCRIVEFRRIGGFLLASMLHIYIYMLLLWEVADNVTIVKALVERAAASDAVKASFGYEDFAMDGWIRLNKKCKNIIWCWLQCRMRIFLHLSFFESFCC